MKREIVAIITAITGDRIIVGKKEIEHAMRHFYLPQDIFLELLERILKEPDDIYVDALIGTKEFRFFYKNIQSKYILVVVKIIKEGAYFSSMYSTGKKIRNAHKKLKRLKL